jgi:hypothetical protein
MLRLELGVGDVAILTLTWAFASLQMTEKRLGLLRGGNLVLRTSSGPATQTTETLALRMVIRSGHRPGVGEDRKKFWGTFFNARKIA